MKNLSYCLFILGILTCIAPGSAVFAQSTDSAGYIPVVVGFYNLENLYDTVNNQEKNDEEFLPKSAKRYDTRRYQAKLDNMASVIAKIGTQYNPDGPALLGVVEVENDTALTDLVLHPALESRGYQFVQFESPDERGIDVALLYQPAYFRVLAKKALHVKLDNNYPTRDILWVQGLLLGDTVHVLVNHWPSRRGGNTNGEFMNREVERRNNLSRPQGTSNFDPNTIFERPRTGQTSSQSDGASLSEPNRLLAATVCRHVVDSIQASQPGARILVMGDFNDDPFNKSIAKILRANKEMSATQPPELYNPYASMLEKGFGTLAYNGKWNLFDQILFSQSLLNQQASLFLYKAHIYYNAELVEAGGDYKGYPKRSWVGDVWHQGYSDHLPVYTVLLRADR